MTGAMGRRGGGDDPNDPFRQRAPGKSHLAGVTPLHVKLVAKARRLAETSNKQLRIVSEILR